MNYFLLKSKILLKLLKDGVLRELLILCFTIYNGRTAWTIIHTLLKVKILINTQAKGRHFI